MPFECLQLLVLCRVSVTVLHGRARLEAEVQAIAAYRVLDTFRTAM
jgi:hypothetical protein